MLSYLLVPLILISFCFYVYSVYRCRLRTRVLAKAFTSLIFVVISISSYFAAGSNTHYFVFMLIALSLCTCGDVFLEISQTDELGINYFIYSLSFFFAAHVAFLTLFCFISGVSPIDFFATAAVLALMALVSRLMKLDFLNMDSYVLGYSVVVAFMLVKSFSLLYGVHGYSARNILVATGAGLFFASNVIYGFTFFGKKTRPKLGAASTGIYYAGQVLIALSVLFAK